MAGRDLELLYCYDQHLIELRFFTNYANLISSFRMLLLKRDISKGNPP